MSLDLPFRFLISTSQAVYLYDLGLRKIHEGNGVYFGISSKSPQYFVLARNNFDGTGGGNPNGINSLIIFDEEFKALGDVQLEDFVKDGHQIYCKDNILYVCSSGLDAISKIHSDGRLAYITFGESFGNDICHYNSINYYNDKWYITQHRTEKGKDNGGVSIYDSDWKFLEFIEVGKHVHNCNVKDGFLWVTDSSNGAIVRIELNNPSNKVTFPVLTGYLSRGLIITDQFLLCGLSEFDTRENRHSHKNGRISVFKYPEIEFLDQIIVPNCGQINDLFLTACTRQRH